MFRVYGNALPSLSHRLLGVAIEPLRVHNKSADRGPGLRERRSAKIEQLVGMVIRQQLQL